MFDLSTNLPSIRLVDPNYSNTVDRILGQIIREAAREWLRAVITSVPRRGGFPVVTGAAISTLKPLGRLLRVAIDTTPRPDLQGRYRGDRRSMGEENQTFKIVDKGGPIYSFEWSSTLLHYYINEFFGTGPHEPWYSLQAGEEAFITYLNHALSKRIPNVEIELI